jgi:hypothetical protein
MRYSNVKCHKLIVFTNQRISHKINKMSSEFSWGLKVQYTPLDQRQQHVHHFPDNSGEGGVGISREYSTYCILL